MNCIQEINFILEIISNFLYCLYEILIFSGISIIYSFEAYEYRLKVHNDVTNICNNYCKDIWFDIGWKMCEIFTCGKIFYKKSIIPKFHSITNDYFINSIILIKNGEEIKYYKNMDLFINATEYIDYDTLFYTDFSNNNSKQNYTIISESNINNPIESIKHKCDANFIIFQLTMDNIKYDINLKEPKNFMIKNNTLKMPFFKWYIKKIYNVDLKEDYSVNYMTQDMTITNLQSPFFIKLNDEGITSFSSGKPKIVKEEDKKEEEEVIDDVEYVNECDQNINEIKNMLNEYIRNNESKNDNEGDEHAKVEASRPTGEEEKEEEKEEEEEPDDEEFKCPSCKLIQSNNWCFKCDSENTCQNCVGHGGDDNTEGHEEWICEICFSNQPELSEEDEEEEDEYKSEIEIEKNELYLQSLIKSIEINEQLKEHYD